LRVLSALSLHRMGRTQFTLAHLMLTVTLVCVFLSLVISRSGIGVGVLGYAVGLGMIVAGWHHSNRVVTGVGVLFVLFTGVVLFIGFALAGLGSANPTLQITFEVRDAQTGLPIPSARLRLRDLDGYDWKAGPPSSRIPVGEAGAENTTDRDGQATIAYRFIASTRDSYFGGVKAQVFVHWGLYVTIFSEGYTPLTAPLQEYTGAYVESSLDGSELAHVTIYVEPERKDDSRRL
jgi:hypothetical protein